MEGASAGAAVGRYLRGEIDGKQGRHGFTVSPDIDFIVPQLWDQGFMANSPTNGVPVTLRVARDVHRRRLVLQLEDDYVPLGRLRTFLRRRRAAIDIRRFDVGCDASRMRIAFLDESSRPSLH
jgi:hypothetical protein